MTKQANANATRAIAANASDAIVSDAATLHAATKQKRATKLARDNAAKLDTSSKPAKRTPAKRAKLDDNATFTLATLARELGISPKIVRAKARRNAAWLKANFSQPAKHVYFERDRAGVTAFVMRDRKQS